MNMKNNKIALSCAFVCAVACVCACNTDPLSTDGRFSPSKMSVNVSEDESFTKAGSPDSTGRIRTGRAFPVVIEKDTLFLVEYVSDYKSLTEIEDSGDNGTETKGTIITTSNITGFQMSAYADGALDDFNISDSSHPWNNTKFSSHCNDCAKGIYFKDVQVNVAHTNGITKGTVAKDYYWFNEDLNFWSVANVSPTVGSDRKSLSFEVSHAPTYEGADAEKTKDILVAYNRSSSGNGDGAIDITLHHAMTVIDFDINPLVNNSITLNSVALAGPYSKGNCQVSASGNNNVSISWSKQSTPETYLQDYTVSSDFNSGTESLKRGNTTDKVKRLKEDSGKFFFLIPQTVTDNHHVAVYISVTSNGKQQQFDTEFKDIEWKAGKRYTYTLQKGSKDSEYFIDDIEDIIVDYTGNIGNAKKTKVNSYFTDYWWYESKHVGWTLSYSEDGSSYSSTKPSWISSIANTDQYREQFLITRNDYYTAISVQVKPQTVTKIDLGSRHDQVLRALPETGSDAKPVDLSKTNIHGIARNTVITANCYTISEPGWYCFPIVYGNAIDFTKNATNGINEPAYKPGDCDTYGGWANSDHSGPQRITTNFRNAFNKEINSPFILEDIRNDANINNLEAQYVWQDKDADSRVMINNATIIANTGAFTTNQYCKYIKFHISQEDICQGNIMLALRDKTTKAIYWSWHIWVTDTNLTPVSTGSAELMPVNVGTCFTTSDVTGTSKTAGYYPKRICYVKVTQDDSKKTRVFRIIQNPHYDYSECTESAICTFYQWGRKDPFLSPKLLVQGNTHDVRNSKWSNNDFFASSGYENKITAGDNGLYAERPGDIGVTTQHPYILYYDGQCWFTNNQNRPYYNLWDSNQTGTGDQQINKTIYDPCPPEYCVPNKDAFSFIGSAQREYCWNNADGERRIAVGFKLSTGTVYFDICNRREQTGKFDGGSTAIAGNDAVNSSLWTGVLCGDTQGYSYQYGTNYGTEARQYTTMLCVRPIKEKASTVTPPTPPTPQNWKNAIDNASQSATNIGASQSVTMTFHSYKFCSGQSNQAAPWKLQLKIKDKDSSFQDLNGNYGDGEYGWEGSAYSGNGSANGTESITFTFNSTKSHTYYIRVISTEDASVYTDFTINQTISSGGGSGSGSAVVVWEGTKKDETFVISGGKFKAGTMSITYNAGYDWSYATFMIGWWGDKPFWSSNGGNLPVEYGKHTINVEVSADVANRLNNSGLMIQTGNSFTLYKIEYKN